MQLRGSFPALITPMQNGKVDEVAFRKFVNWQIEQGSHGLVPVGTTGESPTLDPDEHKRVIEICIEEVRGRRIRIGDHWLVDYASCNYLGLDLDPATKGPRSCCAHRAAAHRAAAPGRRGSGHRGRSAGRGGTCCCTGRGGSCAIRVGGMNRWKSSTKTFSGALRTEAGSLTTIVCPSSRSSRWVAVM